MKKTNHILLSSHPLCFPTSIAFILAVLLAAGTLCVAEEEPLRPQIQQWIQQLGDDSFFVRQRAETLLIRAGIQAYPDLQRAKQHRDIEVVRRAEYVLSQIEQAFLEVENREVAVYIKFYIAALDLTDKARIIWLLTDPAPVPLLEKGFEKGEGLQTLCRLVRFEENDTLRLEAAKTLIAVPPLSSTLRQKWYRSIRDSTPEPGDDELLQCLAFYTKLWCDLDDADEKITPAFQDRVRQVSAETLRLLERPENIIQTGSKVDLLLLYAVAELQDAAGLMEDRDKTVAAALALQPEPLPETTQFSFGLYDHLPMNEHYYVGWWLSQRFRLHWAKAHFQKVMETGHILLRAAANSSAAELAVYLADYSSAAACYDKYIELLENSDYKDIYADSSPRVALAQRQKVYCLAKKAVEEENWEGGRDAIMQAWLLSEVPISVEDMDLVILAYNLCKQKFDADQAFKDKTEWALQQTWNAIVRDLENVPDMRCNAAAWLLANTDGDYSSALILAEAALKAEPDNVNILDTLAHVYFLGGKVDEAIRTQERVVRLAPEAVIFRQALERFKQAPRTVER